MLPRDRGDTTRAEPPAGIRPMVHSVLAVRLPDITVRQDFFKGTSTHHMNAVDGVSTYLALIFGTLLSSQGTDASFVLTRETLSRLSSGRFPSVLRFRLYQTVSRSDFLGAFQVSAFAFPFPAAPTLSEVLSRNFRLDRVVRTHSCAGFPFRRSRKRTGAGRLDANRGAPLLVDVYEVVRPQPRPAGSSAGGGRCQRPICPACGG
jgi:hypothetical protein